MDGRAHLAVGRRREQHRGLDTHDPGSFGEVDDVGALLRKQRALALDDAVRELSDEVAQHDLRRSTAGAPEAGPPVSHHGAHFTPDGVGAGGHRPAQRRDRLDEERPCPASLDVGDLGGLEIRAQRLEHRPQSCRRTQALPAVASLDHALPHHRGERVPALAGARAHRREDHHGPVGLCGQRARHDVRAGGSDAVDLVQHRQHRDTRALDRRDGLPLRGLAGLRCVEDPQREVGELERPRRRRGIGALGGVAARRVEKLDVRERRARVEELDVRRRRAVGLRRGEHPRQRLDGPFAKPAASIDDAPALDAAAHPDHPRGGREHTDGGHRSAGPSVDHAALARAEFTEDRESHRRVEPGTQRRRRGRRRRRCGVRRRERREAREQRIDGGAPRRRAHVGEPGRREGLGDRRPQRESERCGGRRRQHRRVVERSDLRCEETLGRFAGPARRRRGSMRERCADRDGPHAVGNVRCVHGVEVRRRSPATKPLQRAQHRRGSSVERGSGSGHHRVVGHVEPLQREQPRGVARTADPSPPKAAERYVVAADPRRDGPRGRVGGAVRRIEHRDGPGEKLPGARDVALRSGCAREHQQRRRRHRRRVRRDRRPREVDRRGDLAPRLEALRGHEEPPCEARGVARRTTPRSPLHVVGPAHVTDRRRQRDDPSEGLRREVRVGAERVEHRERLAGAATRLEGIDGEEHRRRPRRRHAPGLGRTREGGPDVAALEQRNAATHRAHGLVGWRHHAVEKALEAVDETHRGTRRTIDVRVASVAPPNGCSRFGGGGTCPRRCPTHRTRAARRSRPWRGAWAC